MQFKIEVFKTGETVAERLSVYDLCRIPGFEFADESVEGLKVGQGYCTPFLTGHHVAHVIRTK